MQSTNTGPDNTPSNNDDVAPFDAAVLIVVDAQRPSPRYLMGLRNAELVFMPSKFVFPGGRVDPEDQKITPKNLLSNRDTDLLLQRNSSFTNPAEIQALPLAAIRETFEETGVLIGSRESQTASSGIDLWRDYFDHGVSPDLSPLKFCARAITPAKNIRRYDTRFFCVSAEHIAKTLSFEPGELDEICWLSFEETENYDLALITKVILQDVHQGISSGAIMSGSYPVPFYYTENGQFRRETLT